MTPRSCLVLAAVALVAAPSIHAETRSDGDVAVARAMVDAINRRDLDALDGIVAADVVRHCAATPGVVVENLEQFKAFLRADFVSVPDSVMTIDRVFGGDGGMVGMRAIYAGTQAGAMGPFPPTGKRFELPFIGLLRIEDGKVAEIWVEWDNLGPMVALGHIELPGGPPADGDG